MWTSEFGLWNARHSRNGSTHTHTHTQLVCERGARMEWKEIAFLNAYRIQQCPIRWVNFFFFFISRVQWLPLFNYGFFIYLFINFVCLFLAVFLCLFMALHFVGIYLCRGPAIAHIRIICVQWLSTENARRSAYMCVFWWLNEYAWAPVSPVRRPRKGRATKEKNTIETKNKQQSSGQFMSDGVCVCDVCGRTSRINSHYVGANEKLCVHLVEATRRWRKKMEKN